jgi:hypothetical protein
MIERAGEAIAISWSASLGKGEGGGAADPAGDAGHDRDRTVEVHVRPASRVDGPVASSVGVARVVMLSTVRSLETRR